VDWAETSAEVIDGADIIWSIGNLSAADLAALRPGQLLMGLLTPYASAEHATALAATGATAFAMELLPRISEPRAWTSSPARGRPPGTSAC
jgi:NAD(P) transhydrogenase subunit alpha